MVLLLERGADINARGGKYTRHPYCLIMFRKLRISGSKPAPSAPATTVESKTVDPSPRAIHISDVRRSPTKLPRKPGSDPQSISIFVANAKGAADSSYLYRVRTQRNQLRVPPAELTRTIH